MQQIGQIVSIHDSIAVVAIRRGSMCKKCGACVSFSSSDTEMSLAVPPHLSLSPGDTVKIEIADSGFLLSIFLIYGIPVIVFVCGVLLFARFTSEPVAALLALILCGISYFGLSKLQYADTLKKQITPQITGVVHDSCH